MNLHDVVRYLVRANAPADRGQARQLLLAVDRHEAAFKAFVERLHLDNPDADLRELFGGAEVAPAALPGSPAYEQMLEEQRAAGINTEGGAAVTEEVEGAPAAPNPNTPATEGEPGAPAPAAPGEADPAAPDQIAPGEAPPRGPTAPNTPAEQTPAAPAPAPSTGSEFATPTHEPGSLPVDRTASGEERARTVGDPLHAPEEEAAGASDADEPA